MEVKLKLKEWRIKKADTDGKQSSRIVGSYQVVMDGKIIASQSFNGSYDSKSIPFSSDIIRKVKDLQMEIEAEISTLIE